MVVTRYKPSSWRFEPGSSLAEISQQARGTIAPSIEVYVCTMFNQIPRDLQLEFSTHMPGARWIAS